MLSYSQFFYDQNILRPKDYFDKRLANEFGNHAVEFGTPSNSSARYQHPSPVTGIHREFVCTNRRVDVLNVVKHSAGQFQTDKKTANNFVLAVFFHHVKSETFGVVPIFHGRPAG